MEHVLCSILSIKKYLMYKSITTISHWFDLRGLNMTLYILWYVTIAGTLWGPKKVWTRCNKMLRSPLWGKKKTQRALFATSSRSRTSWSVCCQVCVEPQPTEPECVCACGESRAPSLIHKHLPCLSSLTPHLHPLHPHPHPHLHPHPILRVAGLPVRQHTHTRTLAPQVSCAHSHGVRSPLQLRHTRAFKVAHDARARLW